MDKNDAINMSLDDLISSSKSSKKNGEKKVKPTLKKENESKGKTTSREAAITMSLDDMISSDRKDRKAAKGNKKGKSDSKSGGKVKLTAAKGSDRKESWSKSVRSPKGGKGDFGKGGMPDEFGKGKGDPFGGKGGKGWESTRPDFDPSGKGMKGMGKGGKDPYGGFDGGKGGMDGKGWKVTF